ncbi:MAG: hypothetical protein ABSG73_11615 [Candidatus Aminicenantales bacterium]|jgi:hypothetical protein
MSHIYGAEEPWPAGVWVRLDLANFPNHIWFTYIDPEAGFSAGSDGPERSDAPKVSIVARPPWTGITCIPLSDEEVSALSLPAKPDWLQFYGPQPQPGSLWGTWRNDPGLKGKFHPEFPDDIQVLVHEGGARIAKHPPEGMWVRVTGSLEGVYTGIVLNTPFGLTNVHKGLVIKFLMPQGGAHPVMVTDKYLAERDRWVIHPCNKCGLTELLDAPSDFVRVVFPNLPKNEVSVSFTSKCSACSEGVQVVEIKDIPIEAGSPSPGKAGKKWRWFWK